MCLKSASTCQSIYFSNRENFSCPSKDFFFLPNKERLTLKNKMNGTAEEKPVHTHPSPCIRINTIANIKVSREISLLC